MTDKYAVKSEVKVNRKSEAERDLEDARDKIKAGAKAVGNRSMIQTKI